MLRRQFLKQSSTCAAGIAAWCASSQAADDLPPLQVMFYGGAMPSVQADLLARLDRPAEARAQLERALALATNGRERELLRQRLQALPDR